MQLSSWLLATLLLGMQGCDVDDPFSSEDEESPRTRLIRALDAPKPARSDEHRPDDSVVCFGSYSSFKRAVEQAGRKARPGYEWHHIVNQNRENKENFPTRLHCTDNLVMLHKKEVHEPVSRFYQTKQEWTGDKRVYQVIAKRSWSEQYEYGVTIVRKYGGQL